MLPYASTRGPSASITLPSEVTTMVEVKEVLEAPGATNHPIAVTGPGAEDSTLANNQAGSHATTALPIACPIVPSAVSPHQLD